MYNSIIGNKIPILKYTPAREGPSHITLCITFTNKKGRTDTQGLRLVDQNILHHLPVNNIGRTLFCDQY